MASRHPVEPHLRVEVDVHFVLVGGHPVLGQLAGYRASAQDHRLLFDRVNDGG